jgi:hypothetical protein
MKTERVPANCFVEKLMCDCGTEMKMQFPTVKPDGKEVFIHVCPACSSFHEDVVQFPRLVWEAA